MKKSELLNWLQEEYQQWEAFLDRIGPTRMEQPGVAGPWSIKDIVAHLTGWNHNLVARLQAAQRSEPGPPPPWPAHLQTEDEINAWIYESNQGRPVREVLIEQEWHLVRLNHKRFPAGEFFDHFHDKHEPDMRAGLARVEKQ